MSGAGVKSGVLARDAIVSLLRVRLAECGSTLRRIYHDTMNAPGTLINIANEVQTLSLGLKLVERHAQIEIHAPDVLDQFIELWQAHLASIEQLTSEIFQRSAKACLPRSLYTSEQEEGLHKLVDKLDRAQNDLRTGLQLYHQEEQSRRWLERQDNSVPGIIRPNHGHTFSGIEVREHARAHFGDAIYNSNIYITQGGPSPASQQTVSASHSSAKHESSFDDDESERTQCNKQIATMRKTMLTNNAYVASQLRLILQQTQSLRMQVSEETSSQSLIRRNSGTSGELLPQRANARACSKRTKFRVRIRLPILLSSRIWEIAHVDAYQGWDLCFRTYNRRSNNALIFKYCEAGNFEMVKEMIFNGQASLLDVDESGNNLLSKVGSTDRVSSLNLIRWLLQQDVRLYGNELRALLVVPYCLANISQATRDCEKLTRIFVGDFDEYYSEMDLESFAWPWFYCNTTTCLDILWHRFAGSVQSMSASEQFRFFQAIVSIGDSAESFLRKIEICSDANSPNRVAKLDHFCQAHGVYVLHYVAKALGRYVKGTDLKLWMQIGATAIQNGADPVAALPRVDAADRKDKRTPLLRLVSTAWAPGAGDTLSMRSVSTRLEPWIHVLKSANVDLAMYFTRESRSLRSLRTYLAFDEFDDPSRTSGTRVRLLAIECDPWTQRRTLYVRHETLTRLMRLHHLPGSFMIPSVVPDTIFWDPNGGEHEEGHWLGAGSACIRLVGKRTDLHELINLQDLVKARTALHQELIDYTQDDNGILTRVLDQSWRSHGLRKRSSSQPVPSSRARPDHKSSYSSNYHRWLPHVHFCFGVSSWVICTHGEARDCAKRKVMSEVGYNYNSQGFLVKAHACQMGLWSGLGSERDVHDCTQLCPQGCGKVNFGALALPCTLPPAHPGRYEPPVWWSAAKLLEDSRDAFS